MKTLPLSFDQFRRQIRRELFLNRQQDKDHSEARLFSDAKKLDTRLIASGYKLIYPTEWCKHFDENRHQLRLESGSVRQYKDPQMHLNSKLIVGKG